MARAIAEDLVKRGLLAEGHPAALPEPSEERIDAEARRIASERGYPPEMAGRNVPEPPR
jgi:hypothetical protein